MRSGLFLALALAGCAQPAPPRTVEEARGRQCFAPSLVRGYQDLGEDALLLRVRVNEVWRADFEGACPNIRFNLGRIGLQQRYGGQICSGREVDVVFNDAGVPRRCLVSALRRLTEAEVAALAPGDRP